MQVGRKFNYCSLLAQDLSQKLKRKVEVLNFGVASYSIAQDYLRYESLAKKFAPDLVILSFRAEETVRLLPYPTDQLMAVRPVFFANPDGSLIYDNTCVRNFLSSNVGKRIQKTYWLRRNSFTHLGSDRQYGPDFSPASLHPCYRQDPYRPNNQ